jgi:hypothetical protein
VPTTYAPARTHSVARLSAAVVLLAAAGVALAAPAAAAGDSRRPTATVTHGPSCGPGVVRTLVTNGSEPHTVALLLDGLAGQDVVVPAGDQVELVSPDVDWGVTVHVLVAVTAADGTPEPPLDLKTYTRPSAEDCAAVTSPTSGSAPPPSSSAPPATPDVPATPSGTEPETTPPTTGTPVPSTTGVPTTTPHTSTVPTTTVPTTTGPTTTVPRTPRPGDPTTSGPGTGTTSAAPQAGGPPRTSGAGTPSATAGPAASSSAAAVSPGGVVTLRATGFTAGEPVTVTIPGIDEPLTTVTAAADGSVETVVQIPRDAELGSTTVRFTGTDSATTAGLDLDVAARDRVVPESTGSPAAVAAGVALVAAAGTLGVMGARRSRGRHADADR